MSYHLRGYILPPGSLIRSDYYIWPSIPVHTLGLVIEHSKPAIIDVLWLFPKGEYKQIKLTPDNLGSDILGWTDQFTLISLPEGIKQEKWPY